MATPNEATKKIKLNGSPLIAALVVVHKDLSEFLENLARVNEGSAELFTPVKLATIGSAMVDSDNALQMLGLRYVIQATDTITAKTT